jgi:hypothetical protein
MIRLYHNPGNASQTPRKLLEELGVPFELLLCGWTRGQARLARGSPHLGPHLERALARPAVQRAFATEKLQRPLV